MYLNSVIVIVIVIIIITITNVIIIIKIEVSTFPIVSTIIFIIVTAMVNGDYTIIEDAMVFNDSNIIIIVKVHVWSLCGHTITDFIIDTEVIDRCPNDNIEPSKDDKAIHVTVFCLTHALAKHTQRNQRRIIIINILLSDHLYDSYHAMCVCDYTPTRVIVLYTNSYIYIYMYICVFPE